MVSMQNARKKSYNHYLNAAVQSKVRKNISFMQLICGSGAEYLLNFFHQKARKSEIHKEFIFPAQMLQQ